MKRLYYWLLGPKRTNKLSLATCFDFRSLDFKDSNSKFWRRWLLRLLWSFSKSPFLRFLNVTKIRNEELETWDLAKTKLKVQNNPGNHFKWPHKIQKWTWPHKRTKLSSPKIIKNQNLTSEYRQLISSEIIICMIFCIRSLVQRSFVQDRWVNDRRFWIRHPYYNDRIFKCFNDSLKMYLVNIATTVRLKMTKWLFLLLKVFFPSAIRRSKVTALWLSPTWKQFWIFE